MTAPESIDEIVSADTTEADLEEVLKGLKQEQLDKLAKELSKKAKPEDMIPKWNEAKEKIKRKQQIQSYLTKYIIRLVKPHITLSQSKSLMLTM